MTNARAVLERATTALLVASALAVAAVAVHREFFPGTAADAIRSIPGWKSLASARAPVLGPASARNRVVLFSDYQCPYCRDLERKLDTTVPASGGDIAVVRYDLPLTRIHAHAYAAALAARCAQRQGRAQRFDALLFARDLDAPGLDFPRLAREAGVADMPGFRVCMDDPATARGLDADMALAHRLGIEGVPAMIVGGKLYSGTMEASALESLLSGTP